MTRWGKRFGAATVLGLAAVVGVSPADDHDKSAKLVLKGGYTIVKGERDGEPIPPERIKGAVIRFTDDKTVGTDKEKKELYVAKFTLDTSKTPWKIAMTTVAKADKQTGKTETPADDKQASTIGLIKKEGDTIVIIYALPGGKEPTEFRTQKGDKTQMFWLKNQSESPGRARPGLSRDGVSTPVPAPSAPRP